MANINIQSLFADIISTPEQREEKLLKEGMLQGQLLASGLKGRAANLAPLAQIAGQLGVQRQENLRRAVQPMLGIDPRTTGEKMAEQLKGLDPESPNSLLQAAQAMQSIDPVRAASLRQAAAQKRVEQKDREDTLAARERQEQLDALTIEGKSKELSQLASRQAALPEIAESFENRNFDDIAAQVRSGSLSVKDANVIADARTQVEGSEEWKRLSNTEIFETKTGRIIDSGAIPAERTITVGEGENKRIIGLNQDGTTRYNILARDLMSGGSASSSDESNPNSEADKTYGISLAKNIQDFNSIKGNIVLASELAEQSVISSGRLSNVLQAATEGMPPINAAIMQSRIELERTIDSIKANVAFDRLQKMRDESKTGGALGNVSNIELGLLESTIASLDSGLSTELLISNLQKVQRHYQNILNAEMGLPIEIDLSDPVYSDSIAQDENGTIYVKTDGEWRTPSDQNSIVIKNL